MDKKSQTSPESQIQVIRKKNTIRIAFVDDKAYWVYDNAFYEADVIDGEIDNSTAVKIDAIKLPSSKVNMLLDILDSLS